MTANVYTEIKTAIEIAAKLETLKSYIDEEADEQANRMDNEDAYTGKANEAMRLVKIDKVRSLIGAIRSENFRKGSDKENMEWLIRIIR